MKKKITFLILDILLISLAIWLSFILRFDGSIPSIYMEQGIIIKMIFFALVFLLPIFYAYELYSFSWSYVSTNELIALFKAITLGFGFLIVALYASKALEYFPRSVIIISYVLIFIFSGSIRFSKRVYSNILDKNKGKKTLILGAGDAGEQILRSIQISKEAKYYPVGFIDDDQSKKGLIIHSVKVLGGIKDIPATIQQEQAECLIIALPSASSEIIKEAVALGREAGLNEIKILPSLAEIINGKVALKNLREIQIEDLLGRKQITLDTNSIESFINNKVVLITGAAGSIGSELSRQVVKFHPNLVLLLDQEETGIFNISKELQDFEVKSFVVDIGDKDKINEIFGKFKPDVVFHTAAYKHVPLMEAQPDEAVKNNIFNLRIVAEASLAHKSERFVFISTDKAVNPTSVMGVTKRIGEMICQTLNQRNSTKFISVRFGNVLNSRGSVTHIFKEQIKKGGPVEVTHPDMKRYLMIIPEAVLLVMQSAAFGQGGEVFVLDMGEPVKILDLAKELIKLFGFEPDKDIPIIFTHPRPGEKLFEEVLNAEEGTIATQNKSIFRARLSEVDELRLNQELERLKIFVQQNNQLEIVNVFKKLVPTYNK